MIASHYTAMLCGYAVALAAWLGVARVLRGWWPATPPWDPERPGREVAFALLGVVGVLALGQLWGRGIRLPETGSLGPLLAATNQILIFAPILFVPAVRRQPWGTAWLGGRRLAARAAVGAALSLLAVVAYALARSGAAPPWRVASRIWTYDHLDELVQVFAEDVAVAVLFVRCAALLGRGPAVGVVAALFAAGHIPAMLAHGASVAEIAGLLRDAGLGVAAILVMQRSRDVVWFTPVHFSMDMTQFERVTFG